MLILQNTLYRKFYKIKEKKKANTLELCISNKLIIVF